MINLVKFSMSQEYKHAWNFSARACFHIFENLDNCMLLYKYKLPYHGVIFQKFGFSNPKKLDLNKLDGKNIILFHLDTYRENTQDLRLLLDFCQEKQIDVYIPITDEKKLSDSSDREHIREIFSILKDYKTFTYDFSKDNSVTNGKIEETITNLLKPLLRDIKMKQLFNQ